MANLVANGTQTSFSLNADDRLYVPQGVSVINTTAMTDVITLTGNTATNTRTVVDGTVIAFDGDSITLGPTTASPSNQTVLIGETGVVRSLSGDDFSRAVVLIGSGNQLTNHGEMSGRVGFVGNDVDDAVITNTGSITADAFVGLFFQADSANLQIINVGDIFGEAGGIQFATDDWGTITNSGTIASAGNSATVATIEFSSAASSSAIRNSGEIIGRTDAIDFNNNNIAATLTLENSGRITGNVELGSGADFVVNSGRMTNDVDLGGGDDTFDGLGGTVLGTVSGGTGDDFFAIDNASILLSELAGQGTDTVLAFTSYALEANFEVLNLGGGGAIDGTGTESQNTLRGNAGDNKLTGLGSRDTILGRAGNDTIDAGRGNDTVDGGEGDDAIAGRAGDDILNGGNGSDFIFGGIGSDTINGGSGDDRIKGGAARDELTGAAGSDTFIFCSVTDSTLGPGSDRISDFEVGNDKLDFTNLISGQLTLASGSHTGGGTASVFTSTTGSGNTNVLVDVDGDGSSDMRVVLLGSSGLTETDFIL